MTRITRTMPGSANDRDAHRALTEDALKRAEFERDCYRVLGARERTRSAVIQLASHQAVAPADATVQAARELRTDVGCRGISCHQGRQPCRDRCSAEMAVHSPEPREPNLSLWRRIVLAMQSLRAGFRRAR